MYSIYLSIGTNKGDKLNNIKNAISLISQRIGTIERIAPIYKTTAWGFDGDDFLNSCLEVKTTIKPPILLNVTQSIEQELGRIRTNDTQYSNRIIDIDILMIDQLIINTKKLIVPHPKMLERNFVLTPLTYIAPRLMHPTVNKSIENCLVECSDTSVIEKTSLFIEKPVRPKLIIIEGNIGAGKTSLTKKLANYFNSEILLEEFNDNLFLAKFYNNPEKYAFLLETSFLIDRHQQLDRKLKNNSSLIVSDYYIYKSLIFAKTTLNKDEFDLYEKLFSLTETQITTPDLYIYLEQNSERLLENIQKRGRDYEKNIEKEYLEKINKNYTEFMETKKIENILKINVTQLDFMNNEEDFNLILEKIISKTDF